MDTADIRDRQLARELTAKGYPSPKGTGWTQTNVARLAAGFSNLPIWGHSANETLWCKN